MKHVIVSKLCVIDLTHWQDTVLGCLLQVLRTLTDPHLCSLKQAQGGRPVVRICRRLDLVGRKSGETNLLAALKLIIANANQPNKKHGHRHSDREEDTEEEEEEEEDSTSRRGATLTDVPGAARAARSLANLLRVEADGANELTLMRVHDTVATCPMRQVFTHTDIKAYRPYHLCVISSLSRFFLQMLVLLQRDCNYQSPACVALYLTAHTNS